LIKDFEKITPLVFKEVLKRNVISIILVGKKLPKMIGHTPLISQLSPTLYKKNNLKKRKFVKNIYFLIVKGPLNPHITSLGEKL